MEVVSPGANGHAPSSIPSPTIDPSHVVQHLKDHLEVTLGASVEELESPGSLLSEAKRYDTVQRCTRFASESQTVLYVLKDIVISDQSNGDQDASGIDFVQQRGDKGLMREPRK